MTLERQVLNFLELEVFAEELYRQHTYHVPRALRPLMKEFADVEAAHVARFSQLYANISGQTAPKCHLPRWVARLGAWVLAPLGWKTILRFECWVEERAVEDYRAAMAWIMHAEVRTAIHEVLRDEERHAPYLETLKRFCADEEHHIDVMRERLSTKK